MTYDEAQKVLEVARSSMVQADRIGGDIAALLHGRLRHVPSYHLKRLKRELRDFNIHTEKWRAAK